MIEVRTTPSEQSRQFVINRPISGEEVLYADATEALRSPIANKLFGFPWTETVLVGTHSVVVTKQDWVEWKVLEEPLKGLLEEHFNELPDPIEENPSLEMQKGPQLDSTEAQIIQKLIEEQINPALASHNGYVVLHSVEDNKVFMEMGGGCQGCAMSYQTLKEGIEGAIKQAVPSITTVVDVTNHAAGANPFY